MRLPVPSINQTTLQRRVLDRLPPDLAGVRLILFQAPSGYGKTVAMTQLFRALSDAGRSCVWVTLQDVDNETERLVEYLSAAVADLEKREGAADSEPKDNSPEQQLIDRMGRLRQPFAIFLDELETIRDDAALDMLRYLLAELPAAGLLVAGTQRVPQIGLARLRMQGRLLDFGTPELRFDRLETGEFLTGLEKLPIDEADLDRLHSKTEGWPAALRMAAVTMRQRGGIAQFVERFSGADAAIGEYLTEGFVGELSPALWSFLLRCSILREMSHDICAALCPDSDTQARLEELADTSALIIRTGGEVPAFRCHALLSSYLRSQLRLQLPDEIPALHRRASRWFEGAKKTVPAIDHALQAGDANRACDMLKAAGPGLLKSGRLRILARWLEQVPTELLSENPDLLVMQAWAVCFTAGPEAARAITDLPALVSSAEPHIQAELSCIRLMMLAMMEQFEEAEIIGQRTEASFHLASDYARNTARICMENIRVTLNRPEAVQTPVADGQPFSVMYSESVQGIVDLQRNRFQLALARFRVAASAGEDTSRPLNGNVWAGIPHALTLFETGDLTNAGLLLRRQLPHAMSVGLADHIILASTHLSRISFDRGEVNDAFEFLVRLERCGHERRLPRVVAGAQLERARLFMRQTNLRAAREQLRLAKDNALWQRISSLRLLANDLETHSLTLARLHLHSGDGKPAQKILNHELHDARQQNRERRALVIRLLQAAAWIKCSAPEKSRAILQQALPICAREHYYRLVLDEGQPLADALHDFSKGQWRSGAQTRDPKFGLWFETVLNGLTEAGLRDVDPADSDPLEAPLDGLTPKELQLLHLLAEGYSNAAMSEKLFVSDSTVRTHLRNINSKLMVNSRARAVAVARRMRLIP